MKSSIELSQGNNATNVVLNSPGSLMFSKKKRIIIGVFLISLCVTAGVIQSEVVQALQTGGAYQKPYAILWFAHSNFMLILPLQLIFYLVLSPSQGWKKHKQDISVGLTSLYSSATASTGGVSRLFWKLFWQICAFSFLLTFATYLWYLASGFTTPPRLSATYNTSVCFAYLFEVWLLKERWTWRKSSSVLLSLVGVLILSLFSHASSDVSSSSTSPGQGGMFSHENLLLLFGDFVGLMSAVVTGLVEVFYKKYFVPKDMTSIPLANLVSALIGFMTFAVLWFPMPLLHLVKVEPFELPTMSQFKGIAINGIFSVLYNSAFLPVIALNGAVWASIGVILCIPAVTIVDWIIRKTPPTWPFAVGATMVVIAFGLIVAPESDPSDLQDNKTTTHDKQKTFSTKEECF